MTTRPAELENGFEHQEPPKDALKQSQQMQSKKPDYVQLAAIPEVYEEHKGA